MLICFETTCIPIESNSMCFFLSVYFFFFDHRSLLQSGPLGGSSRKKNESRKSEKKVEVVEMA